MQCIQDMGLGVQDVLFNQVTSPWGVPGQHGLHDDLVLIGFLSGVLAMLGRELSIALGLVKERSATLQ